MSVACFKAKLAAFSRKIMFHSHYIALMTNVGRCKRIHNAMEIVFQELYVHRVKRLKMLQHLQ